jgi:WD40 repeat protein
MQLPCCTVSAHVCVCGHLWIASVLMVVYMYRFGRGESSGSLFFIVNSNDRKHAVLCKVHSISFQRQRQEGISRHPATSLEISSQGRWLAFATADLAVGVVCAQTLDVVRYFEHVHTFAITSLAFSPDARLLASGSAAGACHVVQLPTYMKKKCKYLDCGMHYTIS